MPAAAATPWIIAGVSGLVNYYTAKKTGDAVKSAAATQTDAGNKSIALQEKQAEQARGDYTEQRDYTRNLMGGLSPYTNLGNAATGNLGALVGRPQTSQTLPSYAGAPSQPAAPTPQYTMSPMGPHDANPHGDPTVGQAIPRGGPLSSLGPQQSASSYITMQDSQTGETRQVPAEQQAHFEQFGGKRIG